MKPKILVTRKMTDKAEKKLAENFELLLTRMMIQFLTRN